MRRAALYSRDPFTKQDSYLGEIENETSLGKSAEADIRIDDMRSAGIHALIERKKNSSFHVIDLGSKYGTYWNGKKVSEIPLKLGDSFIIGGHHLVIKDAPANPLAPSDDRTQMLVKRKKKKEKSKVRLASDLNLLQVSMYWGEQLLEVRTFRSGSDVTIGNQREATFELNLGDPRLQKTPYRIAKYSRGELLLSLPEEATGLVWTGQDTVSLDMLRHRDQSKDQFDALEINLRLGDRADVQLGELTLAFRFVAPSEKVRSPWSFEKTMWKIMALTFLFYFFVYIWLANGRADLAEQDLDKIPKHLKRVVVDAGIEEALKRQQAAIGQLMKNAGRARSEEGKAAAKKDRKNKKNKKKAKKVAKNKAKKKKLKAARKNPKSKKTPDAEQFDLDAAFSSSSKNKPVEISDVSGRPTQGNTAAAVAQGNFARGTTGLGAGGGGKSVGIGQLTGTAEGGAFGASDYGLSPSKGKEIKVAEPDEIVILGGLDPEIIAQWIKRYLAQIRNCYEQSLAQNPNLKGKVTVKFVIGGNGGVRQAKVVETSLRNVRVERCIEKKILTWKFPKPRGGGKVGVKYPFLLMSNTDQ